MFSFNSFYKPTMFKTSMLEKSYDITYQNLLTKGYSQFMILRQDHLLLYKAATL